MRGPVLRRVLPLMLILGACTGRIEGGGAGFDPDGTQGSHLDGATPSQDGGGGAAAATGPACPATAEHGGEATYYDATGSGNCSFDPTPDDLLVAAMNTTDYAGADACGACVSVDGPAGSVTVRIVDRCPGCAEGDLDLSRQAFAEIASLSAGRVAITWRYVACDVTGPIRYHFQDGSWGAFQVRNHRYGVARVEARAGGGPYAEVSRALYNYFVDGDGLGSGPVDLRLTDASGHVVDEVGLGAEGDEIAGAAQFPACP